MTARPTPEELQETLATCERAAVTLRDVSRFCADSKRFLADAGAVDRLAAHVRQSLGPSDSVAAKLRAAGWKFEYDSAASWKITASRDGKVGGVVGACKIEDVDIDDVMAEIVAFINGEATNQQPKGAK